MFQEFQGFGLHRRPAAVAAPSAPVARADQSAGQSDHALIVAAVESVMVHVWPSPSALPFQVAESRELLRGLALGLMLFPGSSALVVDLLFLVSILDRRHTWAELDSLGDMAPGDFL